jgi:hypothetical protein
MLDSRVSCMEASARAVVGAGPRVTSSHCTTLSPLSPLQDRKFVVLQSGAICNCVADSSQCTTVDLVAGSTVGETPFPLHPGLRVCGARLLGRVGSSDNREVVRPYNYLIS